jgi:hypothetical protein
MASVSTKHTTGSMPFFGRKINRDRSIDLILDGTDYSDENGKTIHGHAGHQDRSQRRFGMLGA